MRQKAEVLLLEAWYKDWKLNQKWEIWERDWQ